MSDQYVWPEDPESRGGHPTAAEPSGPAAPEPNAPPPTPEAAAGPSSHHTPPHGFRAQRATPDTPARKSPMGAPPQPTVAPTAAAPPPATAPPLSVPPPIAGNNRPQVFHGRPQARPQSGAASFKTQPAPPQTRSDRASVSMTGINVRAAAKLPPTRGWRRWLMTLTGINTGLSQDEIDERELHAKIRKVVDNHNEPDTSVSYQAAVISVKGGVGKTAMTVLLGSVLAKIRNGMILAIDADPDAGNLVKRAGKQCEHTVAELVAGAGHLTTYNAVRAHTSMNDANLEILAAQDYVDARRPFSAEDWTVATKVTSPFYPIILADCGTGLFHDSTQAILNTAWGVVIVAGTSLDEAQQAAVTLDWMRTHGYADLLGRTVVVVNHTDRGRGSVDTEAVKARFAQHIGGGNVFELPFEPHIKEGKEIHLALVSRKVRRRITEIGAALSENFDRPRKITAHR